MSSISYNIFFVVTYQTIHHYIIYVDQEHYGVIVQNSNSHILFERNLEQINPGKRHLPK